MKKKFIIGAIAAVITTLLTLAVQQDWITQEDIDNYADPIAEAVLEVGEPEEQPAE